MPVGAPGGVSPGAPNQCCGTHGNGKGRDRAIFDRQDGPRAATGRAVERTKPGAAASGSRDREAVLKQCTESGVDEATAAMVFAGPGWHLGVLGIVASRLV